MLKNNRLEIRLFEKDYDLIKKCADKYSLTVSKFILAVLIPYCLKNGGKNEDENL